MLAVSASWYIFQNTGLMIKIYTVLFSLAFLLSTTLSGQSSVEAVQDQTGYIVTLSGDRLTGKIADVMGGGNTNFVLFINDFGTPYMIRAEIIRGFAFKQGKSIVRYETQFDDRQCMFMKVVVKGKAISLYRSISHGQPTTTNIAATTVTSTSTQHYVPSRYYIAQGGRQAIPVKRWGFRRKMRKLLKPRAPELASKIGDKGYRFKNLEKIIKEYNREFELTRYTL